MPHYVPTIGLEIHAELKTATKMFCRSKNDPNETRPNVNICPVCMAHPGTLPVINREAVSHVLRVGLALNAQLADYTEFDRKSYFYPDLPKGYQISQYEYPLVSRGELGGISITRVHLEEDTASSLHEEGKGTTVDYNRAGVPLMELVTEPVITSAKQAGDFARELQLLLRYLGASEANMEKGEMRVEANVSVANTGQRGTKVEIKNLNSFRAMERAVEYEIQRQTKLLERGERVVQETRGWDEGKQATFPQRLKEGSADYRYFPDPDLPSLILSEIPEFSVEGLRATMPELPSERRVRYLRSGLKKEDADSFVIDQALGSFFEQVTDGYTPGSKEMLTAANYIANDLVREIRDSSNRGTEYSHEITISAHHFKEIIAMVSTGKISSRIAKDLLARTIQTGVSPTQVAEQEGLFQAVSTAIGPIIDRVITEHESVVADYRSGKEVALEYLVGQAMKILRGAADAGSIRDELRRRLSV